MTSMSDRAREISERLAHATFEATWSEPDDLARRAMEAVAGESLPGRMMRSLGSIHLAGDGVEGSSARMSAVGDVMSNFQRLVAAEGAAQEGIKSVRGAFPAAVLARTHLRLVASPLAGSVVLEFMPESAPAAELRPTGDVMLLDEPRTQRADEAVSAVIELLADARDLGPDVDGSNFLARISDRGPRVAAALRELTRTLATARFRTEFAWREPGRLTRRTALAAEDAARIAGLIASRELDHGETFIEGTIHTVSDRTALAILTTDGAWEYVRSTGLSAETLQGITWGSQVRIVADTVEERRPGGEVVIRYTAKRIDVLAEGEPSPR